MQTPSLPRGDTFSVTARWVFPLDQPPLEQGTITIQEERIVAVEPPGRRKVDFDFGNVALLPGLVNAHTHLDLSDLRGKCPPGVAFVDWLKCVIRHRRSTSPAETQAAIRSGIEESLRYGVTLVGDIASGGASWDLLAEAPLRAVVYHELLGLPRERCLQGLEVAGQWLSAHPGTDTCRPGLSPHAPYSVAAPGLSHFRSVPLAIHLAETLEEKQLLENQSGPLKSFLEELKVWAPDQLVASWEEVLRLTASPGPVSYVHANYLPSEAWLPAGSTVVFCPRTHAAFGHTAHLFPKLLDRGVRVALGTDSLASNPDLDVLAEARFAHAHYPEVSGAALLRMATLSGAEALGWADETGSLTPGKSADLAVLPLPPGYMDDPHLLVLESRLAVQAVLWRGEWRRCEPPA